MLLRKRLLATGLAGAVFIFTGIILSVFAYLTLSLAIDTMIRKDRDDLARTTAEMLAKGLGDLERSVQTLATILSLSDIEHISALDEKTRSILPDMSAFDQIVIATQKSQSAAQQTWEFHTIVIQSVPNPGQLDLQRTTLNFDSRLLSHLRSSDDVTLITRPEFFHTSSKLAKGHPFAFVYPMRQVGGGQGYVIAVSHGMYLLDRQFLQSQSQIGHVRVRDLGTGDDIYYLENESAEGYQQKAEAQVYEFRIKKNVWEVSLGFRQDQKGYFLKMMPWIILVFGLLLTAAGAAYMRGANRQTQRIGSMNKILADKNTELETEIRKRAQIYRARKRSENEYRSIIDAVSDIIFEVDAEGQVVFLNATWQRLTGFPVAQSLGQDLFRMLPAADQDRVRKEFYAFAQGHKSQLRVFTQLRHARGDFRSVELVLSMLRRDESQALRVQGSFIDVEERRRAERALSEAEKKYRTIVENAAGGIFQLTPEGIYLSANMSLARILGYSSADDLLNDVKDATIEVYLSRPEHSRALREAASRDAPVTYETQIRRRDGSMIWVQENVRAVKDDDGHILFYEGSLEDIQIRKQSEVALQEARVRSDLANRAKSEFLANMSHELRTPLNCIIGFSEILKNQVFGPLGQKAYADYAHDIYESGQSLLNVINDVLDIAKIDTGERTLNDAVIMPGEVVGQCLQMLENKRQNKNLTMTATLSTLPALIAEELAFKQIFLNILGNAIKFTPSGGHISVSGEIDGNGALRISVTDTGIGLDPQEIERILSPFGQADSGMNRKAQGAGLGLTLVDALIKLHQGRLELFSQKGIGTTVTVIFPSERVQHTDMAAFVADTAKQV